MTVCGDQWLKNFIGSLSDETKDQVTTEYKEMVFRFGDGRGVKATEFTTIPIILCGKKLRLGTYVVEGDLPLLFSRQSLKHFGVSLDIKDDKIVIGNQKQDLIVTKSGLYVADLLEAATIMLCKESDEKKMAEKLHRYFGHPSEKRLSDLVRSSDFRSKNLLKQIKEVSQKCEHCLVYQRNRSKPKTSLLSASDVNDLVGMDLKDLSTGDKMFHCIDLFSRFSMTSLIPNKSKETIVEALFQMWVSIFGRPNVFLTDNGGEFVNQDFMDLCDELEINVKTTAAYAPFSNGICERHNGIIADSYSKLIEDVKCSPEIALAWATNAKNSLANTHGYSPYMLVFGMTPSIPGLDNVKSLTSLDKKTVGKVLSEHLQCMQLSRKAFFEANQNAKVKRSLSDRICQVEEKYYMGDLVYYKKENQKKWSGPATVIGQDGKLVFVRHGGFILRVHVIKVVLKSRADREVIDQAHGGESTEDSAEKSDVKENYSREFARSRDVSQAVKAVGSDSSVSEEELEVSCTGVQSGERYSREVQSGSSVRASLGAGDEQVVQMDLGVGGDVSRSGDATEISNMEGNRSWESVSLKKNGVLDLQKDNEIRYKSQEMTGDSWESATVIGPGGTVRGKNKNLFNIKKTSDDSLHHVQLDKCEVEKKVQDSADSVGSEEREDPTEYIMYIEDEYQDGLVHAVSVTKDRFNEPEIVKAMEAEMDVWKKYGVYKEVKDTGQKTVSTRWVVTQKGKGLYKARLVVRGFEEELDMKVDSPTGDKCSSRIMMILSIAMNWKLESIDIKAAFLQSQSLDRVVFVRPPRNLKKVGVIWQLEKPAYGLDDSPRNWYNSLRQFMLSTGCSVCKYDPALFYYQVNSKLIGMLSLHVDDFLFSGTEKFKSEVVKKIMKNYDISSHVSSASFKYIGMNICQLKDCITLDQFDYAETVKIVDIPSKLRMKKQAVLSEEEKPHYLSLLGKLAWLSYISRPDLKWDVYNSSRHNKNPTIGDLQELNKVVSKLNVRKRIRLTKLDLKKALKIVVYSDASFGNLDNKVNSSRGYIIFLCCEEQACCLTWAANKVSRVVSSTLESETLACVDGLNHAEWLRGIISELLYGVEGRETLISIVGFTDSNQLYQSLHSTHLVSNHKLRRDVEIIKEKLATGVVSQVKWVPTGEMLADPLTKKGVNCTKLDHVLETGLIPGLSGKL